MIQSNKIALPINITAGQYTIVRAGFVSDEMLVGKVIRFNPGVYTALGSPSATAFQILYDPTPGNYEFTKINCKNHKAFIKIIDAFNFEVEYRFFATKNLNGWIPDVHYLNSKAFEVDSVSGFLGMHVRADNESAVATIPFELNQFCESPTSFLYYRPDGTQTNGYTPGESLKIDITTNGTVSNNFFVGLVKDDSVSNAVDIVPGLIVNYARVGFSVYDVLDLPNDALFFGVGFTQLGTNSKASITLDGFYLTPNSSYKIYVVYYQDGQWKSCISSAINQVSLKPAIRPIITTTFTDQFGNETDKQCVKGLSKYVKSDICITIDTADYDAQLAANGYSGTFASRLLSVRAYEGTGISSNSGKSLSVIDTNPTFCINNFLPSKPKAFVIFRLLMQMPGYQDIISIPFELVYDAPSADINVLVYDENGQVNELCEDVDYIVSEEFEDCLVFQSIDGAEYTESTLIDGIDLNVDDIPIDSNVCLKAVCDGTDLPEDPQDGCDCDDVCGTLSIISRVTLYGETGIAGIQFCYDGEMESATIYSTFVTIGAGGGTGITSGTWEPCSTELQTDDISDFDDPSRPGYVYVIGVNKIEIELENGCKYMWNGNIDVSANAFPDPQADDQVIETIITLNAVDCECPEAPPICENYASLYIDCQEDVHTVYIETVTAFESEVDNEETLLSLDGGLTFVPCPDAVIGQSNLFIVYNATFTDGCEPIHIEQVVECLPYFEKSNSRTIELNISVGLLEIDIETDFNSDVLKDTLFVSIDGGITFETFDLLGAGYSPISLLGGENIVAYTETFFEDGFTDLKFIKTLKNITAITGDCAGYDGYALTVVFDDESSTFTVSKTGSETGLEINELLWTINSGNPFDTNNSGIPYTDPVIGEGMFISGWKIKLPNCPEKIIHNVAFGKQCLQLCDDINVNVNLGDQPITIDLGENPIKMCIVECCENVDLEIECIDMVLTVTGFRTGSTLTWTGPNGFTAEGASVAIEDEGTYYVTATDNSDDPPCVTVGTYAFIKPDAGTPIDNPILIND